ncbi:DUF3006 domain-containing protein [Pseudogracilibacillus sp. SE30717A]|uniref:DUF3006 domain-containing protein n=1 Tax=Pseudogracilibacillus sp. SE30717A TaxID=3098293 RepID=UPI00300E0AED
MKGVLDRIEDGVAVILVEEKGDEFTIAEYDLPAGSEVGTWFKLDYKDAGYTILAIDEVATGNETMASALLLKQLQSRKKQSKFKRN